MVSVSGFSYPPRVLQVCSLGLYSVSLRCPRLQVPLDFGEAVPLASCPLGDTLAGLLQSPWCLRSGSRCSLWVGTALLQGVTDACSAHGISAPTPFLTWQSLFFFN